MENDIRMKFAEERAALKKEFGYRFFLNGLAIQRAAAFWGVDCDLEGLIKGFKSETIVKIGKCSGKVGLLNTSKDYWLINVQAKIPDDKLEYDPSVFNTQVYYSYEDARRAGINTLTSYFETMVEKSKDQTDADIMEALEQLRAMSVS